MKARAPGKLILSGEHAIVHGRPALAIAVNRYASVESHALDAAVLRIGEGEMDLADLPQHLAAVQARHQGFLQGRTPIREVVPGAADLLFAAAALADIRHGVQARIASDIPLGAGLGSSAAVLLAFLKALRPDWDDATLSHHALACEKFQHGRSSGLDVFACLHGGLIRGTPGHFSASAALPLPPFEVWDSGRPEASTGECVAAVGKNHPTAHPIWDEFARVAAATEAAWSGPNPDQAWRDAIRENHRLLNRIGVVPPAVHAAITEIEAQGGAAKTCGAGSIRGEGAGMVLVLPGDPANRLPPTWRKLDLRPHFPKVGKR